MKVIQIMDNFSVGGGVNSFVYDLCHALKEQGCDVSLIGILKKGYDQNPEVEKLKQRGIRVECIGASSKKEALLHDVGKLKAIIKNIAGNEFTVCNLHLKLSVLMGVLATCGMRNIKRVETYHSQYSKYFAQQKVLSPFISRYIPCSQSACDEFVNRFHPNRGEIVMIPNGVNREELRKQAVKEYSDGMITAISVGRFTQQKNFHVTAKAFSDIEDKRFEYKIFGSGELEQQIKDAASGSNNISFCGSVPRERIFNELANASIVVMPSLWEGLSIFMLEAFAFDCPMMISNVPTLRNVFNEEPLHGGETWRKCDWGYLVETSNVDAYREAMEHYLLNQNQQSQMRKAIEGFSKMYSIEETARKYISVYNSFYPKK